MRGSSRYASVRFSSAPYVEAMRLRRAQPVLTGAIFFSLRHADYASLLWTYVGVVVFFVGYGNRRGLPQTISRTIACVARRPVRCEHLGCDEVRRSRSAIFGIVAHRLPSSGTGCCGPPSRSSSWPSRTPVSITTVESGRNQAPAPAAVDRYRSSRRGGRSVASGGPRPSDRLRTARFGVTAGYRAEAVPPQAKIETFGCSEGRLSRDALLGVITWSRLIEVDEYLRHGGLPGDPISCSASSGPFGSSSSLS